MQVLGPVIEGLLNESLKPKVKRIFSITAGFEGGKAFGKSILFGALAFSAISGRWDELAGLPGMQPLAALALVGGVVRTMAMRVAMAWLAIAGLDFFFQRKQINKQLMMTKEELKQEMRESEGSPELKVAIAIRRRKLKKRMMDAVRTADVVVTNPTHYAVAIEYKPGEHHAPIVVAKGADFLAAKIREVASEARVPIVPNPPLARALYRKCEIGDFVPRDYFQAVAEVLAYVYRTLKRVRKK